jgi:hypothetical protein
MLRERGTTPKNLSLLGVWRGFWVKLRVYLNTELVQEQIASKTFTQATLSTLGDRIFELVLPVHKDTDMIKKISTEIQDIIKTKARLRKRTKEILAW